MTTVSAAVEATRRHLYGMQRGEYNRLNTSVTSTATSIALEFDLRGATRGAYLAIEDELLFVLDAVPSTKTVTVMRGMLGTTAAAHDGSTTPLLVEVNPRFPTFAIRDALKDEIRSWPNSLFRVATHTVTFDSDVRGYDFVDDWLHILAIQAEARQHYVTSDSKVWREVKARALRGMDTDDFASGSALIFETTLADSTAVRVLYARSFDTEPFVDATDLVTDVGLATSMLDIPPLGAAWRLLSTREVARTDLSAQGQPRDAEEVPPGHISQTAEALRRLRDVRINQEAMRLTAKYPIRGF